MNPHQERFLACLSENKLPPRDSPVDSKHEIIIFHELVDRFLHRPRFPAAPQPNYHRYAIRHRGDSKKSTHPSPTRNFHKSASRSVSIFIKTQGPTAAIPLVPTKPPHHPYPSSPSRFLRDVGAATRVGRRPRERKILTIGKSRVVSQSSVEKEFPRARVPRATLRRAS